MDILFKNKTIEHQFSSQYQKKWKYPEQVKHKLLALENAIISATSLNDIATFPPYRFHRLLGDRKSEWSISLGGTGYRVTLIPCDDIGNPIITGDIMAQCKKLKIVLITEVSNHYE